MQAARGNCDDVPNSNANARKTGSDNKADQCWYAAVVQVLLYLAGHGQQR